MNSYHKRSPSGTRVKEMLSYGCCIVEVNEDVHYSTCELAREARHTGYRHPRVPHPLFSAEPPVSLLRSPDQLALSPCCNTKYALLNKDH